MGWLSKIFSSPVARILAPIALSILAPGVGSAIGSGLGLGTLGGTAAGALGGAALGAGYGVLSDGKPLQSAITGGLGGAASGFVSGGGLSNVLGSAAHILPAGVSGPVTAGSGVLGALGPVGTGLSNAANSLSGLFGSGSGSAASTAASSAPGLTDKLISGLTNPINLASLAANTYSGVQGTQAYKDMAAAQQAGNNQAIGAITPFLNTGTAANQRLSSLLGLSGDSGLSLDTLRNDPGYQFRLQEGEKAQNRSLGAQGKLFSGAALKASQEFGQGLADQTYNDAINRLSAASASGQSAAGSAGELYQNTGNITANSINGQNNTVNQSLANILGSNVGASTVGGGQTYYDQYGRRINAQGQLI